MTPVRVPGLRLGLAIAMVLSPVAGYAQAPSGPGVEGLGHTVGSRDAPILVVEFVDMGCRECRRFALETFPAVHAEFIETGQVRWQVIPYVSGLQPNGEEGARALECAADQGAFWPMHDILYERQADWFIKQRPQRQFGRYAEELELDKDRFERCYDDRELSARTDANTRAALDLGVRGTPTFLVNGRMVLGALPASEFRRVLATAGTSPPE